MKKLITIAMTSIMCIVFYTSLFAQEKSTISHIMAVSKESKAKLKIVRTIAVFLNSNDPLLIRIVEDAFAIHLKNKGFTVINREMIEKSVGEQVTKKKREKTEGAINALEIGSSVNADAILTGTLIIQSGDITSLFIRIASFQLIDVTSGKTMLSVLLESEKGMSFSEIANNFVEILKQNTE